MTGARERAAAHWALVILVATYGVMWIGGVATYVVRGGLQPHEAWAPSVFLLLAGVIVLTTSSRRRVVALTCAALMGFAAEWMGARYGWLFGRYAYTEVLTPAVAGVPVVMASAWLVLVAYLQEMVRRFAWSPVIAIVSSAMWLTATDLVIDPVAAGPLGYWRWGETGWYYGIPARNFLGWFAVGIVIFAILRAFRVSGHVDNAWAHRIGISIVLFFTVIAASQGMLLAGTVGLGICVLDALITFRGAVEISPE